MRAEVRRLLLPDLETPTQPYTARAGRAGIPFQARGVRIAKADADFDEINWRQQVARLRLDWGF